MIRVILLLAFCVLAETVEAASISGGDETIETIPTAKPDFNKNEDSTVAPSVPSNDQVTDTFPTEKKIDLPENIEVTPTPKPVEDYKLILKQARLAYHQKNYDEALEKVRKVESLKPDQPEIINFRGAIYAETGRYAEAVELYKKSLAIEPNSFWPAFNIAEVDFIQKKYSDARTKLQEMMVKLPNHELLRFKIILTYLLEKKDEEAKAELDKFSFPANSAAREFALAAWEYAHNSPEKGNEWVNSGVKIFGYGRTDFVYQSLADLGWVPSPRPLPASGR